MNLKIVLYFYKPELIVRLIRAYKVIGAPGPE